MEIPTYYNLSNDELIKHLEALQLEISSACNLKCIMCPQVICNGIINRKKAFMKKELFIKVIDDLVNSNIHFNAIYPFWLGESMMHPDFSFFFEYLMKKNFMNSFFNCIEFDTNAHFLDRKTSERLLNFNRMEVMSDNTFLRIYFSIDSINNETYKKIRVGGDLSLVLKNIFDFIKIREEKKLEFPKVALQMVIQEKNYNEISQFCLFFKEEFKKLNLNLKFFYALNKDSFSDLSNYGDLIFLRPLYTSDENQKQADYKYIEAIKNSSINIERITTKEEDNKFYGVNSRNKIKIDGVCSYLLKRPLITIDGEVLPCFNDDSCENSLGSMKENSFLDIWNGKAANNLRKLHSEGKGSNRCTTRCNGYIKFVEPEKRDKREEFIIFPNV